MTDSKRLFLHEEIMLLALHNEKGTIATSYPEYAIAGAVLAELILNERISVDGTRKQLVQLRNTNPTGEPTIDACLAKMKMAKRRTSLKNWVSRLADIKKLKHKVAQQLCKRGILRASEDALLFIFTRKVYPEINSAPEKEIVERIRAAIFTDDNSLDPRTIILISLANGVDLLGKTFGRKEIRARKNRIKQIANGEMVGKATKEVIEACQAAVAVAAIIPAVVASTSAAS